ncbi:MAG: hypothetical protein GY710_14955 [Desulfobacteraceae bacterium]|nr:hypothetical protein [Desulfobacteraceae bacterium]
MATKSLRIDESLVRDAQRTGLIEHRSINSQLEYWAKLGRAIAPKISIIDAYAVTQGVKNIRLELADSVPVDPKTVFAKLEADRAKGFANKPATSAPFFYEASTNQPGLLDQVETATGKRQTGTFKNGQFEVI